MVCSKVGLKVKKFNTEIEKLQAWTASLSKPTVAFDALKHGPNENAMLSCKIMSCFAIGSDPVPV